MEYPENSDRLSYNRSETNYSAAQSVNTKNDHTNFSPNELEGRGYTPERSLTPPLPPSFKNNQENSAMGYKSPPLNDGKEYSGSLEELDPKTMDFDRLVELMHPKFISDYLGRILAFLKSGNDEICFPNIAPFKEAFLVKFASDRRNLYSESFNETCRSLCRDIMKVLDSNKHVFKWVHSYESGMVTKSVLVYQKKYYTKKTEAKDDTIFKIPQNIPLDRNPNITDDEERKAGSRDNSSTLDWAQTTDHIDMAAERVIFSEKDLTKRQRGYKKIFERLTVPFIMSTLQRLLDFVEDETRQSIEFLHMTADESGLLRALNSFLKEPLYGLLDKECIPLTIQLRKALLSLTTNLEVIEGKPSRRCKLRNVVIKKKLAKVKSKSKADRMERKRIKQLLSSTPIRCPSRGEDRKKSELEYNPREMFLKALSISTDSEDSFDVTDKLDSVRSQESETASVNSTINSEKNKAGTAQSGKHKPVAGIAWQREGGTDGEDKEVDVAIPSRRPVRRAKLAQALSVPVESDKAMRMMRLMGWQGGALGLRGEGITEPIMPAIDIVSGAGLGHSPSNKKRERKKETRKVSSRTSVHFRKEFLESLLDLLRKKDLDEKEIEFSEPICKKERKFISTSLLALNGRKKVGLNTEDEKELVCRVLANLNCSPKTFLDYELSEDMSRLTLSKITNNPISRKKRRRAKDCQDNGIEEAETSEPRMTDLPENAVRVTDIERLVDKLAKTKNRASRRSLIALAYRIILMKKILNFVLSDDDTASVAFEVSLNGRYCKFVESVITNANKKGKASYSTKTENELYANIRVNIHCHLNVVFSIDFRSFTLEKKYYRKRFINTSLAQTPNSEACDVINNNSRDSDFKKYERRRNHKEEYSDSEDSLISLDCDFEILAEDDDECEGIDKTETSAKDNDSKISDTNTVRAKNSDTSDKISDEVNAVDEFNESDRNNEVVYEIDEVTLEGDICDEIYNLNELFDTETKLQSESPKSTYEDLLCKDEDVDNKKEVKDFSPNLSPGSSKRSRSDSETSETQLPKKPKIDKQEYLTVVPKCFPDKCMDRLLAGHIQKELVSKMKNSDKLPYLECLGIEDGGLQYKTFNENSRVWFEDVISKCVVEDLSFKIVDSSQEVIRKRKNKFKMAARVNSFFEETPSDIFNRLELYNSDLSTEHWVVVDKRVCDDCVIFFLDIDYESYRLVVESNYSLHCGVNRVVFSYVWS